MQLRKLQLKDAPLMLEWMRDKTVVNSLQANFAEKTIDDCIKFICDASNQKHNIHLAIVNEADEYMGTVSLKNINEKTAEFAITVRKVAIGCGFSKYGMDEIIKLGLETIGLESIYWCVNPNNQRAIRFYDKNNYHRTNVNSLIKFLRGRYSSEQIQQYIWYQVTRK